MYMYRYITSDNCTTCIKASYTNTSSKLTNANCAHENRELCRVMLYGTRSYVPGSVHSNNQNNYSVFSKSAVPRRPQNTGGFSGVHFRLAKKMKNRSVRAGYL